MFERNKQFSVRHIGQEGKNKIRKTAHKDLSHIFAEG